MSQAIQEAVNSDDGNPALLDTATGALSRIAFTLRLEEAAALSARLGHRLSLVRVDLREPYALCDAYGPHAVDTILAATVDRMWELARRSDTVARIGPARLAVLLPATDEAGAALYLDRLLPVLGEPFCLNAEPVGVNFEVSTMAVLPGQSAGLLM